MAQSRYKIEVWHLEKATLSSGKKVFEVVGASDEAKVVLTCRTEDVALRLQTLLSQDADVTCTAAAEAL